MRLITEQLSLILVGGWNPSILQPNWLAKEIFQIAEGEDVPATVGFPLSFGGPPKVSMQGVTFIPASDNLSILPGQPAVQSFQAAENFATNLLRTLPHTPITAFGENYVYVEDHPNRELLNIFSLDDDIETRIGGEGIDYSQLSISKSINLNGCLLNLKRSFVDDVVTFSFNFHYEVSSAAEAREKLPGTLMNNYTLCQTVMGSYGIDLENTGDTIHG